MEPNANALPSAGASWMDPRTEDIFNRIHQMGPVARELMAALVETLSDQIRLQQKRNGEVMALGLNRLSPLYRLQHALPWVESDPHLKKAYHAFIMMNQPGQSVLCFKLVEPIYLVSLYCGVCQRFGMFEISDDVEALVRAYFTQGLPAARELLESMVGTDLLAACEAEQKEADQKAAA